MPQTNTRFVPELEATRGLAAFVVAAFHVSQTPVVVGASRAEAKILAQMRNSASSFESALAQILSPLFNGHAAVFYFFVLSGFVLAASLDRDCRPTLALFWRFILRRLFRIYPAVMAVVLFITLFGFATGLGVDGSALLDLRTVVANLLLLDVRVDGVMWTMQAELLAAPFIFAMFLLWRKGRWIWAVGLALLLTVLTYSRDWASLLGESPWLANSFYAFTFGVLAYAFGPRVVARISPRLHGPLALLAAALVLATPLLLGRSKHVPLVETAAAAYLVCFLAYAQLPRISSFLRLRPIRFLGRVSCSFYLLHPLTLAVIWHRPQDWERLIAAGLPRPVLLAGLVVATTVVVLPLAHLSHRFVERPGIALGQRIAARLSRRAPSLAQPAPLLPQPERVE